jgi:hypothetical protein
LMDMDFAVSGPLVRRSRLVPGSCPSTRTFAPRFLQTPPRGDSPCALLTLYLHQVGWRTFTSKLLNMPGTQRKAAGSDPAAKPFGFRGIAMLCFALPCHFRIEARLGRWPLDTGPKALVARLPVSS